MSSLRGSETYLWRLFPLSAAGLFEDRPYPSPGSENGLDFPDTWSVASPYLCCFLFKGGEAVLNRPTTFTIVGASAICCFLSMFRGCKRQLAFCHTKLSFA